MTWNIGEKLAKWLDKPTLDQNLEELGQIETTLMNGKRRWFRSAEIKPTIDMGYYDTSTGKMVLGNEPMNTSMRQFFETYNINDANLMASVIGSEVLVNTINNDTITVPTGHIYVLLVASCFNPNRAFAPEITITPQGDTAITPLELHACTATSAVNMIGVASGTSGGGDIGGLPVMCLRAGTTVNITDNAWVAGDVNKYAWVYYDITVV